MDEYIQVVTTVEKESEAGKVAKTLLDKRLVACAQVIGPITSHYWWQGKLEEAGEYQIVMKSRKDLFAKIVNAIKEVHSYDVPEILAVPIVAGGSDYLQWLDSELK